MRGTVGRRGGALATVRSNFFVIGEPAVLLHSSASSFALSLPTHPREPDSKKRTAVVLRRRGATTATPTIDRRPVRRRT